MPDVHDGRFVSLRAAIDRGQADHLTPQQALHFLLSSHRLAPGLLSEARHWAVLARNSAIAASLAARRARDAELVYEHARRKSDPRGLRRARFWAVTAAAGVLLGIASAAAYVLCLAVPWPGRLVLAAATFVLGGAVAWAHRGVAAGRGIAAGLTVAAAVLCASLMAVRVISAHTLALLPLVEAAALGAVLVMAILAAVHVSRCGESVACCRARQRCEQAAGVRDRCADRAFADQAEAVAAAGGWESLVVEECSLMRPPAADGERWLAECVRIARLSAAPAE